MPSFVRRAGALVGGIAGAAVTAVLLGACGTTPSSSGSTTTRPAAGTTASSACALLAPKVIEAIIGSPVNTPTASNRGSSTTCTYKAPNPASSVIVAYQGNASASTYAGAQQAYELKYGPVTAISGLGDQAYVGAVQSGDLTNYTVVTLVGQTQVAVVGSSSQSKVETVAEAALTALYAKSPRGSTTTTTAASSTASSTSPS